MGEETGGWRRSSWLGWRWGKSDQLSLGEKVRSLPPLYCRLDPVFMSDGNELKPEADRNCTLDKGHRFDPSSPEVTRSQWMRICVYKSGEVRFSTEKAYFDNKWYAWQSCGPNCISSHMLRYALCCCLEINSNAKTIVLEHFQDWTMALLSRRWQRLRVTDMTLGGPNDKHITTSCQAVKLRTYHLDRRCAGGAFHAFP